MPTADVRIMPSVSIATDSWRDSGSFRDPEGFIVRYANRIFRVILPCAVNRWKKFTDSGLAAELQSVGLLVLSHEVEAR